MKTLNRRQFLKAGALTAASLSIPVRSWGQVEGANSAIRVAVIGMNGRGNDHIKGFRALGKAVRITALCDVDSKVLASHAADFKANGEDVATYTDIRKLLESKEVDAVSVATPNHWHSLAAIWAVQAGKDVYVEKPVSHNVSEGRRTIEAARKHERIVQTGTQSRSSPGIREAVEWVRAGNLGKILLARGLCYKRRATIGKVSGPQTPPASVDYDLWCGPAPKGPLMRKKLHYDWHWVWATGCGDLGNQGIHQMDIARWFLGEPALSPRVFSIGGRFGYVDDGETPNTMIACHDYEKAPLIFEVRGLPAKRGTENMDKFKGGSVSVIIECEGGHLLIPNYNQAIVYDKEGKEIKRFKGEVSHYGNFLAAVRSRNHHDLNADISEGHISSALCHTANISHRLGQRRNPDEIRESIKGDRDATETFGRMAEHLKLNEVDLASDTAVLGEMLKMDPASESFPGNAEANKLLTRDYRHPFVVPEKV
jgi:predicted dehydrogenase